jgi:isoleucyl-tRNA synthetase
MEALASYEELLAKPGARGMEAWDEAKAKHPELPDDLRVHKPYIDLVEYDSPYTAGAVMERVTEVIDCWYDSGAMPFAQWGYGGEIGPRDAAERFKSQFPADFISEALDQTRGWFYSQLAISTMLWGANDEARMTNDEISKSENSSSVIRHSSFGYPHPFRNCVVLGLMLGEDGQKMSKSKRNYREPSEIFDRYGADAMRWYFFANQPPWTSIRYSEQAIKDSVPEFLLRLWNVYSFFTIYANIDGFDPAREITGQIEQGGEAALGSPPPGGEGPAAGEEPGTSELNQEDVPAVAGAESQEGSAPLPDRFASTTALRSGDFGSPVLGCSHPHEGEGAGSAAVVVTDAGQLDVSLFARAKSYRPVKDRGELDCWILSELNRTSVAVVDRMDQYDNFAACASITEFVDALSNWYVRRSRERFWASDKRSPEKLDAYWTLYESLLTVSKLIAPFTPFLAESLWQNLAVAPCGESTADSVHLCDYPTGDEASIDHDLSDRMNLVRHISSLGRQARTAAGLKVRQPLAKVEVILADATHQKWLEEHTAVIADELNVKSVEFSDQPEKYVDHEIVPNFKLLGPKLGKLMPKVKPELAKQNGAKLLEKMRKKGKIELTIEGETVELTEEDVEIRLQAKPGWAAANDKGVVVVLATELTKELVQEGLARDFVRVVQDIRKDLGLEFTDRIEIGVVTKSAELRAAIECFHDYIAAETLAEKIAFEPIAKVKPTKTKVGEHDADVYVRVAQ